MNLIDVPDPAPCPFCKGGEQFIHLLNGEYRVGCHRCGCRGPVAAEATPAVNAWNRRVK